MTIKYTNISVLRPSKIYPKWDFLFENIPSGNQKLNGPETIFSDMSCQKGRSDKSRVLNFCQTCWSLKLAAYLKKYFYGFILAAYF
jgi:hypothetical protein